MTTAAEAGKAYFAGLSDAKYIQLTTFRKSGDPVPTPVHVVVDQAGQVAYFRTWDPSGKSKRLRRTAAVEVAPSTFRGRPKGAALGAQAHLLEGDESRHAARLLARRHPVLHGWLIPAVHRMRGWTTQQYRLEPPG